MKIIILIIIIFNQDYITLTDPMAVCLNGGAYQFVLVPGDINKFVI